MRNFLELAIMWVFGLIVVGFFVLLFFAIKVSIDRDAAYQEWCHNQHGTVVKMYRSGICVSPDGRIISDENWEK